MSDMRLRRIDTRVYLRGEDYGTHLTSWSASITNDLPGRFTASDSVPQRTGTIEWDAQSRVSVDTSPLDLDFPRPGDSIRVDAEWDVPGGRKRKTVFTGRIDVTKGGMGEPLVSDLIDRTDDLNSAVSWYPLVQDMPRRQGTSWLSSKPGSNITYMLAEIAKQCDFGARYPSYPGKPFFIAPLQGSLFTNYVSSEGALVAAGLTDAAKDYPVFRHNDNGNWGLGTGVGAWDKGTSFDVASNGFWIDFEVRTFTRSMYLYAGARFNGNTIVQIGLSESDLFVYTNPSNPVFVMTVPDGNHAIGMYYPPRVGQNIWIRMDGEFYETGLKRTDDDDQIIQSPGTVLMTPSTSALFLYKRGAGIVRDLQMGRMWGNGTVDEWKQYMNSRVGSEVRYYLDENLPWLFHVPAVESETGKTAAATICEPYCISSWVTGDGILNFASGSVLRRQDSLMTLDESIYSPLEWESSFQHAASRIVVKGKTYDFSMAGSGDPTQEVWVNSASETFDTTNRLTYFVNVPDDEDYFEVDTNPVNLTKKYDEIKNAIGSALRDGRNKKWWWGWYSIFCIARTDESTAENDDLVPADWQLCTVERISPKTYKVVIGYKDQWYTQSKPQMSKKINDSLSFNMDSSGMPILRAGAGIKRYDDTVLRQDTGGPPGPELIHDMENYRGWGGGEHMRDVLASYFATDHPVFSDVTTSFNPEIEAGICLTLDATKRWGHVFKVLVTAVSHDPSDGVTRFTPRVISSERTSRTYAEVEAEFKDYAAVETVGTYNDLARERD